MLHKWQIITLKLNYGIFDYIKIDSNKTTNTYINKSNVFNFENELEEPQLERKPKLLFKNISKNTKNKSLESKNTKDKSNIKAMKIKKENDIRSQYNNNKKDKNNLTNIEKVNNYSASNIKHNKKKNSKKKRGFIPISSEKNKRLNKTKENNDEQHNETFKNKTFEGSAYSKKENFKNYYSNEGSSHTQYKKKKNLIIPINNRNNNLFDNKKSDFNRSNITYQSDFNLTYGMDKSRSVDTVERKPNISSFLSSKTKPWAYSYKRSQNDEDIILKIKKKRPLMSNSERQELFNKLYNDSKKRKEKYKKLSMEKEAKFNAVYTFTPKIVPNKLNDIYLRNMADSKFSINTNATTYYNNGGNSSMINTINNYSLLKRDYTNKDYNLPIVFEENKSEVPVNFITRLAEYEKIKKLKLEKIKNEVDMDTRGNLNKNKNKYYSRRTPYNNIVNSQYYFEKRQKNLDKIVQNIYEEQGITFHPKTNKSYNDKIKNDIIERNKEFIKGKQEKLLKYFNIKEKECTFKPKINNLSTISILNNSKTHHQTLDEQNTSNVSKRLFDYQNKYKEKLEDIRSKYKENYSFKPEISKNTDIILNNRKRLMEHIKENEMNIINNIQEQVESNSNNNNDINENENYNENDNDNENNSDNNNYSNENRNVIINNFMKNNFNNDINKQLLLKQMKLGELEEISKRISELSEENMAYTDQKLSSQKKSEEDKNIFKNKSLFDNKNILYKENNNFKNNSLEENNNKNYCKISNNNNKNNMTNTNSDKIFELAQNLLNENLKSKKMNEIGMDDNENNEKMNYYNNNNGSKQSTNDFYSIMMNNSKTSVYNDSKIHKKSYYTQEYDFDYLNENKRIMDLNYYDNLL